jgi:hypothetical protein
MFDQDIEVQISEIIEERLTEVYCSPRSKADQIKLKSYQSLR